MKKRISFSAIVALILALALSCASAERLSPEFTETVEALVLERNMNPDKRNEFAFGEEVTLDDGFTFTAYGPFFAESELLGTIDLYYALDVTVDRTVGMTNCCFGAMTDGGQIFWPSNIYNIDSNQELAFPVIVGQIPTSLLLRYEVPSTALSCSLFYSSFWINDGVEEIVECGNLLIATSARAPMDIVFTNNTGCSLTELYFAPISARTWGDNLLGTDDDALLPDEYYMSISFVGTEFEDCAGESWECKLVLEDGRSFSFSGLKLDEYSAVKVYPNPDDDARMIMSVSH